MTASRAPQQWMALVSEAFGGSGGIQQYNRDLLSAVALSQPGNRVCVLARRAPSIATTPAGIRQLAPKGRIAYVLAAIATSLRHSFDVVFCGHIHLAPLAAHIARIKGAKLIIQTHGIEVWAQLRGAWRSAIEQSDLILCVSRYTRRIVLEKISVPPERVMVLSNTVGDVFTPGNCADVRIRHGWEKKRILLTVGRMDSRERYKGQDRVIAALPELLAQGHDVVYLIVGEGDDRPRLEQLARNAQVEDRVRFLGALQADQLVEVYRAADLFVMPSTGEGFGISFLEAMACGTSAIGLSAGGARDALGDGALGKIVDENELTQAINQALSQPRPDPHVLSDAVRTRFSRAVFRNSVDGILARVHDAH